MLYNPHAPDWHKREDIPDDITLREYADAWLDMAPHIDQLAGYAKGKRTIVEFGLRGAVSTWAMLSGMPRDGRLIGVDIDPDPPLPRAVLDDPRLVLVVGDAAAGRLRLRLGGAFRGRAQPAGDLHLTFMVAGQRLPHVLFVAYRSACTAFARRRAHRIQWRMT